MTDYDKLAAQYGAQPAGDKYDQLAQQYASPAAAAAPQPLSRMDKFKRGLRDPIDGGAQLLTNMLPDGLVKGVNGANNWLADKTGLVGRLPEGGVDQQVREGEARYSAQRKEAGESGIDGYRMLGNVLNPANLAAASRIPAAASFAGRVGIGAATGAGFGALTPVGEGDFTSEKMKQIGTGAAFGGAVPAVVGGVSRIISPNASRNSNLQLLKREGVRPTVGQALGGMWNKTEEKLTSLPGMGDMIVRARDSAQRDFQGAAFNRALKPVGEQLPKGLTGRDALVHTETVLKGKYDDVLTKIGAIRPDAQFNTKVADLTALVGRMPDNGGVQSKFAQSVTEVANSIDRRGYITSDAFKTLESSLGKDAKKLFGSQDTWDGKLAPAVKQLQEELREMLSRQAGSHANDLRAANAGWANFKRVQGATGKIGAEDGNFNASQFLNAVRGQDKSKDKAAFARGSALGQDLGDAGKTILRDRVPDSGTPGRLMLAAAAGGSAPFSLLPMAGLATGAAAYTSPAQRALLAAISSRPQSAQGAANAFRKSAPMLVPAGAQFGLGMLDD